MSNQNPSFFVFSLSLSLSLFCLGCNEYVEQFWKKQKWEKWEILGIGRPVSEARKKKQHILDDPIYNDK
jgi:hypothetical protein